jgi:hypothetical protein
MKHCRTAMARACWRRARPATKPGSCPTPAGIAAARTASITRASNGWNGKARLQVPPSHFLLTFTLPAQLRDLAWQHRAVLYAALFECAWGNGETFCRNDRQLQGQAGAVAVLHTHSRRLDYHPHVHLAMPGAALDAEKRLWRRRSGKRRLPVQP